MRSLVIVCSCFMWTFVHGQTTTIRNPLLPGFYPDPSIERVNDDYYLVNSTFSYMPGIPIFHSRDLKNWVQIGNVIHRDEQLDFMGEQISRGLFAPAIAHHKGVYYVVCTDIDHDGNFVVTSLDPAGPWSKPVKIPEVHGIDPSLYFDSEHDKAYIVYNSDAPDKQPLYEGHRSIRMYEFDYRKLQVVGQEKLLVNGGVKLEDKPVWIEGPHLYKRGPYYYLCAAEGGTSVNHSQVIFRSTSVEGPYTPWEKNPILTQRHLDNNRPHPITSTGHADLVQGPDGRTYAVFLAVRPYEGNHYNIGRETFIAPVEWTDDGWPIINPGHEEVQYSYTFPWPENRPEKATIQNGNFSYTYNFSNDSLDHSFLFLRKKNVDWYNLSPDGLTIRLQPTTLSEYQNPSFIAKRLQHHQAIMETELAFTPQTDKEVAGLAIFQGEKNYYLIGLTKSGENPHVYLYKSDEKGIAPIVSVPVKLTGTIRFQIRLDKEECYFSYATEADNWQPLGGSQDARHLSTETAGGFVGTTFGPYASSQGTASQNQAIFTRLSYTGRDDVYEKH